MREELMVHSELRTKTFFFPELEACERIATLLNISFEAVTRFLEGDLHACRAAMTWGEEEYISAMLLDVDIGRKMIDIAAAATKRDSPLAIRGFCHLLRELTENQSIHQGYRILISVPEASTRTQRMLAGRFGFRTLGIIRRPGRADIYRMLFDPETRRSAS